MPKFDEIAKDFNKINANKAFFVVMGRSDVQAAFIAFLQRRLETAGTDSEGEKLQTDTAKIQPGGDFYSKHTQMLKQQKGQTITHVNLKDTSEFYNSMRIVSKSLYFNITANFNKGESTIAANFKKSYKSQEAFEDAVLKLTESEFNTFFNVIVKDKITNEIIKQLL